VDFLEDQNMRDSWKKDSWPPDPDLIVDGDPGKARARIVDLV